MKSAARIFGTLSVIAALASLGLQVAVVARLWAAYVETFSLSTTIVMGAAGSVLGLALAIAAVLARHGSPGVLAPIAGLMNLGLLAAYAYLYVIL